MPTYAFYQLDVFTNQPFGGNPLAVFPDATGLTDETMQRIAREMNLSETTFVFPPERAGVDFKVRIFTPGRELPFAGHPVIGTHWLLAHLGKVKLQAPTARVSFSLGVGVRAATVHVQGGKVAKVVMDHQKPSFYATATTDQVAELARSLGLAPEAILDTRLPVQAISTGIRQLYVPVRSLREVQALKVNNQDVAGMSRVLKDIDPVESCNNLAMVFCTETVQPDSNVHARAFAPVDGIAEDPATGSANGGLGAYLIQHRVIPAAPGTTRIVSEQGIEMGRASSIEIEIDGGPGDIEMVRIGGNAVLVIEGSLSW
jgi:trans-2,3-dihydro-3-hydroxyanthranilate isomerase